jgi:hypothetical protein
MNKFLIFEKLDCHLLSCIVIYYLVSNYPRASNHFYNAYQIVNDILNFEKDSKKSVWGTNDKNIHLFEETVS